MSATDAALLSVLLNAAWQATAIAALGGLCLRLLTRVPARTRHHIAFATTLLCVAAPLIVTPLVLTFPHLPDAVANVTATSVIVPASDASASAPWILAGWMPWGCVGLMVLRALALARSVVRSNRLCRGGVPVTSGIWSAAYEQCQREWPLHVALVSSPQARVPIVCGSRAPAIVVPDAPPPLAVAFARAILGHEFAHISRRDITRNLIVEAATMPLCLHPAVMWMKRVTGWYRELAADELAIERLHLPAHQYAQALLDVASWRAREQKAAAALGFGGRFEHRVRAILRGSRPTRHARSLAFASVTALCLVAALVPLFAVTVVQREDVSGEWVLDLAATASRGPSPFEALRLSIAARGDRFSMDQTRTTIGGMTERVSIQGHTDGAPFDVRMPDGRPGRAQLYWIGSRLIFRSVFPEANYSERGETSVSGDTLFIRSSGRLGSGDQKTVDLVFRRAGDE